MLSQQNWSLESRKWGAIEGQHWYWTLGMLSQGYGALDRTQILRSGLSFCAALDDLSNMINVFTRKATVCPPTLFWSSFCKVKIKLHIHTNLPVFNLKYVWRSKRKLSLGRSKDKNYPWQTPRSNKNWVFGKLSQFCVNRHKHLIGGPWFDNLVRRSDRNKPPGSNI